MITADITTIIIGFLFLIVGVMLAVGIENWIMEKFRKHKYGIQQKVKIREMCLRAGEVAMLDGLILLMKGFIAHFENHIIVFAFLAWIIIACFDVLYITVTRKTKKDGKL